MSLRLPPYGRLLNVEQSSATLPYVAGSGYWVTPSAGAGGCAAISGYGVPCGAADGLSCERELGPAAFPVAAIARVATTVRDASDNHHLGRRSIGSWYLLTLPPAGSTVCRPHWVG